MPFLPGVAPAHDGAGTITLMSTEAGLTETGMEILMSMEAGLGENLLLEFIRARILDGVKVHDAC